MRIAAAWLAETASDSELGFIEPIRRYRRLIVVLFYPCHHEPYKLDEILDLKSSFPFSE
jgi:hypothetical protein